MTKYGFLIVAAVVAVTFQEGKFTKTFSQLYSFTFQKGKVNECMYIQYTSELNINWKS